jgi:hypothetical protein
MVDVCRILTLIVSAHQLQAQALREQSEKLFKKFREAGGHQAQRDRERPREDRDFLSQMKRDATDLWAEADALVQAASEQVLRSTQVRQTAHWSCWGST